MAEKKDEAKKDGAPKEVPAEPKKGGGPLGVIVGVVLSAGLAGGAAYGGARAATGKAGEGHAVEEIKPKAKPPGITVQLDPFLANVVDEQGKPHAVKLTVAVELSHDVKTEDEFKPFVPRLRVATISYVRSQSFEQFSDQDAVEKMRKDLLAKWHEAGAIAAERVLVTDLLAQ